MLKKYLSIVYLLDGEKGKGVSIVIGTLIMVMIVIALGSAALVYINSVILVKEQGIELVGASCGANPVLKTDVNGDGWVDVDDVNEVSSNFCNPPGVCTPDQLEKYDVEPIGGDGDVDANDRDRVNGDVPSLSGGHTYVTITNIGTGPINVTTINIERTLPTSGPVPKVKWDAPSLMLTPGNTSTADFICPEDEGPSCEFRLFPPTGKSVTATVYCI